MGMTPMLRRLGLRAGSAALAAFAVSGCVSSGVINARLHDGEPVKMAYRSERFGYNGTMTATMPGGEQYSGRYLEVTAETDGEALAPFWMGWGVGWDDWGEEDDSDWMVAGEDVPSFTKSYSGKVIATLLGDRGGRMRCRFRLANPEEEMAGGGVGQCQTGDKQKIDATF
jgi:hypothetical protein